MPAKSEAQRRYLNAHFGHKWVKKHGFDNKGKLPGHVGHSPSKLPRVKVQSLKKLSHHRGN